MGDEKMRDENTVTWSVWEIIVQVAITTDEATVLYGWVS
jgi:hypothetical protein